MTEIALAIHNLKKTFDEFTLNDISLTLPTGYIMGLVGKNGAGKTTTINLILEVLQKDAGSIKIFNKNADDFDVKQDIAVVFDDVFFVDNWKVKDVESALSSFYKNWDTKVYHDYLKKFALSKSKRIKELSKGMKLKLMLAVSLSHKARLLILDEPTSGLDPIARDELLDILLHYIEDEKNSVLFSTHITTDLEKIADYITVLKNGKIFYSGEKDGLFEKYCMVKGELSSLNWEIEKHLIGISKGTFGFTALLAVEDMKILPPDIMSADATIDEILIHINDK